MCIGATSNLRICSRKYLYKKTKKDLKKSDCTALGAGDVGSFERFRFGGNGIFRLSRANCKSQELEFFLSRRRAYKKKTRSFLCVHFCMVRLGLGRFRLGFWILGGIAHARGMFPPKSAPRDPLNYILEPRIKEKTREQAEQQETLELGTIS